MTADYRALSIRQPWAELILQGRKTVECRTWHTRLRGPLVIHASTSRADLADPYEASGLVFGAIVGAVDVVDVVGRRFAWQWLLEHPRRLVPPIPCRGACGLWRVTHPEALASVAALLARPAPALPAPPRRRGPKLAETPEELEALARRMFEDW